MNWPISQDYNEAVQNPPLCFADPDLQGGEAVVNALGLPVPRSGNFADVYQVRGADGKTLGGQVLHPQGAPGCSERYAKIDEHLGKARLPFTVGFKFLEQGIRVRGQWYPVLKMEWVEGFTLNEFVARQRRTSRTYLHALMQMWAQAGQPAARRRHGPRRPAARQRAAGAGADAQDARAEADRLRRHVGAGAGRAPLRRGRAPELPAPAAAATRLYYAGRGPVPAPGGRGRLAGRRWSAGRPLWDRFDNGDNLLFKESDLRDPANGPVFGPSGS